MFDNLLKIFSTIAPVITLVSGIQSVRAQKKATESQVRQLQAQQTADLYNADLSRQNAQLIDQQTQAELAVQDRNRRLRMGVARATAGGMGGVDVGDLLASSADQERLDLETIASEGQLRKKQAETQARMYEASAQGAGSQIPLVRSAGRSSKAALLLGTISSGIGSF